ncbi:unnamed protein product [Absidia cylindrospora]
MRSLSISFLVGTALVGLASAVKFDLHASTADKKDETIRCFSQYAPRDTKVLVTVNVGQGYNQRVNCNVSFVASPTYFREVDLEVNVGTEAKIIEEITKNKHLPNLEEQTRVLEAMVDDILNEMNYLKGREAKLRNTNGKYKAQFK